MSDYQDTLIGQVAVVTGAGRGIGRSIALAYATAGASVCCAARTESEINAVAAEIQGNGGQSMALTVDVSDRDRVDALFAEVTSAWGRLDILVISSGVAPEPHSVQQSDPDDWQSTIAVNLLGPYHCARAAVPHLKARGGKIITIGSGLGHRGRTGYSAYACSKAGLWMLTRVLAEELWEHNISVNELIPGPVQTGMTPDSSAGVAAIASEWLKSPEDVVLRFSRKWKFVPRELMTQGAEIEAFGRVAPVASDDGVPWPVAACGHARAVFPEPDPRACPSG